MKSVFWKAGSKIKLPKNLEIFRVIGTANTIYDFTECHNLRLVVSNGSQVLFAVLINDSGFCGFIFLFFMFFFTHFTKRKMMGN